MQIIRKPNIVFSMQRQRKGIDSIPFNAESFEINCIGPCTKNLLVPKDDENRLMKNVISGKAELASL